jgi:hypothetical protein
MTKSLFTLAVSAVLLTPCLSQEVVTLNEARRGARKVTDALGTPTDAPFSLTVDITKPQAIRSGKAGLLVIPDKQLSLEAIAASGANITPIGQLWMRNVSLGKEGQAVANDKLRFLTVNDGDQDLPVQLYYLGVKKNAEGKLDLVIFAKDKEPLLTQPLTKFESLSSQLLPIELSGKKEDDNTGTLSLNLLGQYKVDLTVKRPVE